MSTPNEKEWKWREKDPKSNYKQLSVKGTRIKARTIYGRSAGEHALTPEELADDFGVSLDAVHEAIAYVESDPPEIRQDWETEERLIREAEERNDPNFWGPKRIGARLRELGMDSTKENGT